MWGVMCYCTVCRMCDSTLRRVTRAACPGTGHVGQVRHGLRLPENLLRGPATGRRCPGGSVRGNSNLLTRKGFF